MNTMEKLGCVAPLAAHSAGGDLADLDRGDLAVERCGQPLPHRVFSGSELAAAERAAAVITPANGVKESVVKAVGGLPSGSGFADVRVHPPDGDPTATSRPVALGGGLADWTQQRQLDLVGDACPLTEGVALARTVEHPWDGTR